MGGGMEIITGVERRRRWRLEDKLRILAELEEPGVRFVDVARRHDVSRGLLWQWRDARRRGRLEMEGAPAFIPFHVVPALPGPQMQTDMPALPDAAPDPVGHDPQRIEIVLPDGTALRVAEGISATALRRVLSALRG